MEVMVHYLFADEKGPICSGGVAALGVQPARFRVACWPGRQTLKNLRATGDPLYVNCPRCRASKAYQAAPKRAPATLAGELLTPEVQALLDVKE